MRTIHEQKVFSVSLLHIQVLFVFCCCHSAVFVALWVRLNWTALSHVLMFCAFAVNIRPTGGNIRSSYRSFAHSGLPTKHRTCEKPFCFSLAIPPTIHTNTNHLKHKVIYMYKMPSNIFKLDFPTTKCRKQFRSFVHTNQKKSIRSHKLRGKRTKRKKKK